jgi:hypothetical protein
MEGSFLFPKERHIYLLAPRLGYIKTLKYYYRKSWMCWR